MAKPPSSEWAKIDLLRALLEGPRDPRVRLGIGDDAAVLPAPAGELVWTVDTSVEGVHFRRDLLTMGDIGYRATMAAASDLAAMGASPLGLLAALILPRDFADDDLAALARGQRDAADALGTALIGGNLARGGELSLSTTALGVAARALTRAGAQPGDALWMAGPVGLAGAGLTLLLAGAPATSAPAQAALHAWRRPRARIAEGLLAAPIAHAAIDVSDGLAQDLGHLARASGVRVLLGGAALVSADLAAVAAELGRDPLDLALRGGEDYALVVALPAGEALAGFEQIGQVEAGEAAVLLEGPSGTRALIEAGGYDHFRPSS